MTQGSGEMSWLGEPGPPPVEQGPTPSAQAPPRTPRESVGRWLRYVVETVHSRRGVWFVVGGLLTVLIACTVGFLRYGWSKAWIPLYAADAEMLVVASAVYVIAVRWKSAGE